MTQIDSLYGSLPEDLLQRFKLIRLLALDVDGIFSDGRIYMGNQGEELKAFHTLDGYGLKAVIKLGIQAAVITGRRSHIVEQRMQALGVQHIIQGEESKGLALANLQEQLHLSPQSTASMGDDMPDIAMFALSSLSLSVPNGHPFVKAEADYVTQQPGGFGAVREVCDLILQSHDALKHIHGSSV